MKRANMVKKLVTLALLVQWTCQCAGDSFQHKIANESSRVFSPRMDYDEWTPLGRGDPLKNDPTFDYVPPVLDRVQYWLGDTQTSTESSSKRDVLILGVTAKKTSPKIPEHFLKFMDTPKFPAEQPHPNFMNRNDFTGSTGAEPPKVIRNTKFRSGPVDFRLSNKGYYHNYQSGEAYYSEKPKPYTMMLPPPVKSVSNKLQFAPKKTFPSEPSTTSSSVSFEKSNLIYHQSSHQGVDWPQAHTLNRPNPPLIAWPSDERDHFEEHHHAAASVNHEVVVGQNANIIVDAADSGEDKEQIVVGQKVGMQVVLANTSTPSDNYDEQSNVTVSIVMPTNFKEETSTKSIPSTKSTPKIIPQTFAEVSSTTPFVAPTTMMPVIETWQQDQAPPPMSPVRMPLKFRRPSVHRPFSKPPGMMIMLSPEPFRPTTHRPLKKEENIREVPIMTSTTPTTTSTTPATTSVADSFTTDPIFSHYKQPVAPIHGPMYLIIQGHSKVKTYKPTVNKHGVPVETTSKPPSEFEQFVNDNTRRQKTTTERAEQVTQKAGPDSLVNLVEKGVSAFTVSGD